MLSPSKNRRPDVVSKVTGFRVLCVSKQDGVNLFKYKKMYTRHVTVPFLLKMSVFCYADFKSGYKPSTYDYKSVPDFLKMGLRQHHLNVVMYGSPGNLGHLLQTLPVPSMVFQITNNKYPNQLKKIILNQKPIYKIIVYNHPIKDTINLLSRYSQLKSFIDLTCFLKGNFTRPPQNDVYRLPFDVGACATLLLFDNFKLNFSDISKLMVNRFRVQHEDFDFGVLVAKGKDAITHCGPAGIARRGVNGFDFYFDMPEKLKISYINSTPHFIVTETPGSKVPKLHTGTEVAILNDTIKFFNLSVELIPNAQRLYGAMRSTSSGSRFVGVIGDLNDGLADLGVCEVSVSYARWHIVDYTTPFVWERTLFVSKKASRVPSASALWWPLDTVSWLSVLVSVILFSVIAKCFLWSDKYFQGVSKLSVLLLIVSSCLKQSSNLTSVRTSAIRVLLCFWLLFVLVLTNLYSSLLASFMSIPVFMKSVETFDDLLREIKDGRMTAGTVIDSFQSTQLGSYDHPVAKEIMLRFSGNDSKYFPSERIEGVRMAAYSNYAYIGFENFISASIRENKWENVLQLSKSAFSVQGSGWAMQQSCFIKEPLTKFLRKELEAGLVKFYLRKSVNPVQSSPTKLFHSEVCQPTQVYDLLGEGFVLLFGFTSSFLCIFLEKSISFIQFIIFKHTKSPKPIHDDFPRSKFLREHMISVDKHVILHIKRRRSIMSRANGTI